VNEARELYPSETHYAIKDREQHRSEWRKPIITQQKLDSSITPKLSTLYTMNTRKCIAPKLHFLYATMLEDASLQTVKLENCIIPEPSSH
jgi:hypothetical protein